VLAALALAMFACGCTSPALPRTYPASGSVVYSNGQPLSDGAVLFTPTAGDPLLRILGEVAKDGTFTLRTQKDNQKVEGAPAGEFEVQVLLPFVTEPRDDLKRARTRPPPVTLPNSYKVEEKENTFRLELPILP
jgi:hypothetical protein